jgi:Holliday junction resolvasome RuvABC endonuclease subunit
MLLAIDPGYRNMGYCVGDSSTLKVVVSGTIVTKGDNFPDQLRQLHMELEYLICEHNIVSLVYEKPVYAVGHKTGNKVQQSIAILLLLCAIYSIQDITTYTPSEIKLLLTNSGKASKIDIQQSILKYLPDSTFKVDHESDAIGMYICWYNSCVNTVLKP